MLYPKNNIDFVKKAIFGAASSETWHTKTALAPKFAKFFCNGFLFHVKKMCKISILNSHALPEE
jgi:hypothetical protein